MTADGYLKHSAMIADIKVEAEEIPMNIKAEPDELEDYDVKDQTSDKIDTIFDIVRDHSSFDSKPDFLKFEDSMEDYKSLECQPKFIKVEQHKTWIEDSSNSSSIEKHLAESDGDCPTEIISENDELKMEEDEASSESSKEVDNRSREQDLTRQRTRARRRKLGVIFGCTKCGKEYSSKRSIDNHIVRVHSDDVEVMKSVTHKIYRCKHCDYFSVVKSHLNKHTRTHGEKSGATFGCMKCRTEFSSKRSLHNHIVTSHSGDAEMMKSITSKVNRCGHCEYVTVIKSNLASHMRTHGEKFGVTFDCKKCNKVFTKKITLDGHILAMHSDNANMMKSITNKIYCCEHCEYVTIIKCHLIEHMRKHGEKLEVTSECMKCEKEFSSKQSLDIHIVAMHSNDVSMMKSCTYKIHHCKYCSYVTLRKYRLNEHMRTHRKNEEKPITV